MREGVKQFILSICQFVSWFVSLSVGLSVCPSDEKFLNLNVEGLNRFERFPKLTVALTL